ncbi:MAG: hypothetical protein QG621_271 [Patescibacteria group bacterium]|jgi:hypothetical protein|nr:hypothetical protein [Patescibacteria group bacterium]
MVHGMVRRWLRKRWRRRLQMRVRQGAFVASLPAYLDRGPKPTLHRAEKAAFMHGFAREQRAG